MKKEKTINWRSIHSPLLYDVGRHLEGPSKYWDVNEKGWGGIERLKAYWIMDGEQVKHVVEVEGENALVDLDEAKQLTSDDGVVIVRDFEELHDDHWNMTLKWGRFMLLFHRPDSEIMHVRLKSRFRFFNSENP